MKTHPPVKRVFTQIKLNLRFLFIRVIGLTIRVAPCKVSLIRALGILLGVTSLCVKVKQWNSIAGFARHSGSALPGWLYILKYFVQKKTDRIWGLGFYAAANVLKKYITVENREAFDQAVLGRKGVILMGAHYGPALTLILLNDLDIKVRPIVGDRLSDNLGYASKRRFLTSNKVSFLTDTQRTLVANRHVREIVRYTDNGGVVYMLIDFPSRGNSGVSTSFFDRPMLFNYFPFKLALRCNIPVFFLYLDKADNGGYKLCFVPSGEFSTPDAGVKLYASFFHAQITRNPFMWRQVPKFLEWFQPSLCRK